MHLSDPANVGHKDKCWWSPNGRMTFYCCSGGTKWSLPTCTATPASKDTRNKDRGTGVAVKSGEQRIYLGLSESFSVFAAGAA